MKPLQAGDPASVGEGRYRLVGRLGQGGMGVVYFGRSRSGRAVAVKVVRPELSTEPGFRRRFADEVAAARRVGGFHTAPVVDADPQGDPAWLVTAYVPGPTLQAVLDRVGPLPADTLTVLAAGLAEALAAIHQAGVIHRDLKPANIIVAEDGPRVIDFGIARALDGTALTQTGFQIGTLGFLAPEQLTGGTLTPAVDMFALGVVLGQAAGRAPFGDGGSAAWPYRVVHEQPELTDVPGQLRDLVAACLAKDPRDRPSPLEFLDRLTVRHPSDVWLPPEATALVRSQDPAGYFAGVDGLGGGPAGRAEGGPSDRRSGKLTDGPSAAPTGRASGVPDGRRSGAAADPRTAMSASPGGGEGVSVAREVGEGPTGSSSRGEATRGSSAVGDGAPGSWSVAETPTGERWPGPSPVAGMPTSPAPVGERPPGSSPVGERPSGASHPLTVQSSPGPGPGFGPAPVFAPAPVPPGGAGVRPGRRRAVVVAAMLVAAVTAGLLVWHPWTGSGSGQNDAGVGGSSPSPLRSTAAAFPDAPLLVRMDTDPGSSTCHSVIGRRDSTKDDPKQLIDGTCDALPQWAPDHRSFAFTRNTGQESAVWTANADGTDVRRVAAISGGRVSWSPDGKRLAVLRRQDGVQQLFAVTVADGSVQQLTTGTAKVEDPAWSPDGKHIAICLQKTSGWQIHVVDPARPGAEPRQVTHQARRALDPVWSPDGRYFAYTAGAPNVGTGGDIHIVKADGTGDRTLVQTAAQEMDPVWSPDGKWVAFVRGPFDQPAIWAVRADGTGERRLTTGSTPEGHPSWR
ncbi:protein kinase domain-containing protein [Streptomyces sp. NBC_00986]|uniref:protein kinase domain-containing protein n=1 Tax=Streptomyces sp. NBC_00986 TaxID=2903702 RepID=UPI00386ABA4C|nr:protein kinase [Streptomyces sp. NBC_00986]